MDNLVQIKEYNDIDLSKGQIITNNKIVRIDGNIAITEKNNFKGFARSGKDIVKPIFDYISEFKDGKAIVRKDNKYGLIDEQGNYLIPPNCKKLERMENGYYKNAGKGKTIIYYPSGNMAFIFDTEDVIYSGNEYPIIMMRKGEIRVIDNLGKRAFFANYDYMSAFKDDLAIVGRIFIDRNRVITSYPRVENTTSSPTTQFVKYGIIDKKGNQVVDYNYYGITIIDHNHFIGKHNTHWYLVDIEKKTSKQLKRDYGKISEFKNGYAIVESFGAQGVIDSEGNEVIKVGFEKIIPIENNLFITKLSAFSWGVVDSKGNDIIPMNHKCYYIGALEDNNIEVMYETHKWKIYDQKGNLLIDNINEQKNRFKYRDGLLYQPSNNDKTIITTNNKVVLPPIKADSIHIVDHDTVIINNVLISIKDIKVIPKLEIIDSEKSVVKIFNNDEERKQYKYLLIQSLREFLDVFTTEEEKGYQKTKKSK